MVQSPGATTSQAPAPAPLLAAGPAPAATVADVLESSGELSDPENRRRAVEQLQRLEVARKTEALARAEREGIPKRIRRPDGTVQELVAFEGDKPVYFTTYNLNAAISTGANLLLATPYAVNGGGLTVGVWDGGAARPAHQEFGGRVTVKDGAGAVDHATHVGGTIAAAGLLSSAKGMAPAARIDSYDWNSDKSEMTARGASYPGEPGTLYLSNHSYGYIAGWNFTGNASPQWDWWGAGATSTSIEDDFGKYNSYARDSDSLSHSLPYFLVFRAGGNDRGDNPGAGSAVTLEPNGTTVVPYDPALHPAGDSTYRNGGYDTLSFDAVAKNVITIGAINDAVAGGGVRHTSYATMTSFSTWGPTDDGRIKPDLVANGESVYSTTAGGNASYGWMSGTSMATPSAMGSAALLVSFYDKLFPGHALRASTLKALLIHTADDLGTAGPDYRFGWGLMNVKAATDLVQAYRTAPGTRRIVEDRVTTARTSVSHTFTYGGSGPIRVTLGWSDPAAATSTSSDNRTARLVNNLDLQLTGPNGSVHQPFVMPYVGDWTAAKLAAPATTGRNNTDNLEQIFVAAPPAAGTYTVTITFAGTLTSGAQNFSLILSGGSASDIAPAPSATTVSPDSGNGGTVALTIAGGNFLVGAQVKLTRNGEADVIATGVEILGDLVKARVNTSGMAPGTWNVLVTNPDGQSATLANAFAVVGALWADNLEASDADTKWTHSAGIGTNGWILSTAQSHSPTRAFFSPGPATRSESFLVSPPIPIPAGAANLRLTFWHSHAFQNGRDGGVLEFSVNNGAWFDVTSASSGAAFAAGGYNSKILGTGRGDTRSPLAGLKAWSGTTNGFTQVAVDLTDPQKYAGKPLRVRWRLGTDSSTASAGWYVDSITLAGAAPGNLPPSISTEATAALLVPTNTSANLSVMATDDAGPDDLVYTWTVNETFTAPVIFSDNGTATARNTIARFSKPGLYTFTVTVRDREGLTAVSSVDLQVDQTLTSAAVMPTRITLGAGDTQLLTAKAFDQFGEDLSVQPTFSWSVSGGGSISRTGLFTAGVVPGGPFVITAATGSRSATAEVTITGPALSTWKSGYFTAEELSRGTGGDAVDADGDGVANLLEYALGADPRDPSRAGALRAQVEPDADGEPRLTVTFTRPKAIPDVSYEVEVSEDLLKWTELSALEVVGSTTTVETVVGRDSVRAADADSRFMRLRVHRVPR